MPRKLPAVAVLALAACQGYRMQAVNAQPVTVVNQHVPISAKHAPPDIMIVQDTSGSMCEAIAPASANGTSCVGNDNYCSNCSTNPANGTCADPADCATKMQLTSNIMNQILASLQPATGQLFMGLTFFPDPAQAQANQCVTGAIQVKVGDATTTISQIENDYSNIANNPIGGTPTAATLQVAVTDPTMSNPDPGTPKYILLVTDGLPNCNSSNACGTLAWSDGQVHGCQSPSYLQESQGINVAPPNEPGTSTACSCSFGACDNPSPTNATCCRFSTEPQASQECLDDQAVVSEIASLYSNDNIQTIVVGMGADYAGASNATVLDAMAAAGHFNSTHYQASTATQLETVLQGLFHQIAAKCVYQLDQAPADPALITVSLNGTELVAGDPNGFTYTPPTTVTINGTACTQITSGASSGNLVITAVAN